MGSIALKKPEGVLKSRQCEPRSGSCPSLGPLAEAVSLELREENWWIIHLPHIRTNIDKNVLGQACARDGATQSDVLVNSSAPDCTNHGP